MNDQLELFAPVRTPPATNSLFLALIPARDTAQRMTEIGTGIRSQHKLTGKLRPLDHLHISLHWLGDYPEVPHSVVQAVGLACEAVAARVPAFEVTLNRATSFRGRPGNHPLVLVGKEEGNSALRELHQILVTELAKYLRLEKMNLKFNPHVTLLYDRQSIAEDLAESVGWMADKIVLVCSEVGKTKHHHLGEWALKG